MKTLFGLSLLALLFSQLALLSPEEEKKSERAPASLEKRVTTEERKERLENQKKEQELLLQYEELQKLYAQIESAKAELEATEQGLLQLQFYASSPMTELVDNNLALANYLALSETNNNAYPFPSFSLGEMQSEGEALYYGLPYASRQGEIEENRLYAPTQKRVLSSSMAI